MEVGRDSIRSLWGNWVIADAQRNRIKHSNTRHTANRKNQKATWECFIRIALLCEKIKTEIFKSYKRQTSESESVNVEMCDSKVSD